MDSHLLITLYAFTTATLMAFTIVVLISWHLGGRQREVLYWAGIGANGVGFFFTHIVNIAFNLGLPFCLPGTFLILISLCFYGATVTRRNVPANWHFWLPYAAVSAFASFAFEWVYPYDGLQMLVVRQFQFLSMAVVVYPFLNLSTLKMMSVMERIGLTVGVIFVVELLLETIKVASLGLITDYDGPVHLGSSVFVTPVLYLAFAVIMTLVVVTEMTNQLKLLAASDSLTGLLNRRGFEERAFEIVHSMPSIPMVLAMSDIDHFKSINDRFGHSVGDTVIASFAAQMREMMSEDFLVARIGGEEFAILFPDHTEQSAYHFCEILRGYANTLAKEKGWPFDFTASFGVTAFEGGSESLDDALARADKALYAAKNAGRNKTMIATSRAHFQGAGFPAITPSKVKSVLPILGAPTARCSKVRSG